MKKQYGFCRTVLLLCVWLISTAAWAYDFEADGIYYNILSSNDKTVEVTKGYYSGDVIIPEAITYGGVEYRVTAISDSAFYDCYYLTSVTIPESVTTIGNYAFGESKYLTSVTIPESVTIIGNKAFVHCWDLTSITIPGVTVIGDSAFYDCYVDTLELPYVRNIHNSGINTCSRLKKLDIGSAEYLPEYFLREFYHLEDLTIPYVGAGTQTENSGKLGDLFFLRKEYTYYPTDKEVWYAVTVGSKYVNDKRYYDYYIFPKSLRKLTITDGCKELPDNAFNGVVSLQEISLPASLHTMGDEVFSGTGLTSIMIPDSVTSIGFRAFYYCSQLKSVRSKAEIIGSNAFYGCTALDTLELPYVKDIGYSNSSNRDNIGIFSCTGLKKLDIGSAEHLPAGFLSNLTQLEDLTIPYIGAGSKNEATGKNGLLGALFGTKSVSGMKAVEQYYNETKAITSYLPTGLRKLTITDGCEELPYGALYNVSTLREVILPASLYMVGEKAFYGCAGIEHLYCRGAAPAGCYENAFTGMRLATCVLHVPHNSVELYQRSDGWKNFYFIQGEEPIRIDVVKNIAHAGIVTGLTEYVLYDEALLTAIAHSGYRFVSWMEDGSEICTQESYRFRAESNRNLTAVFMPVFNENDVEITPSAHTASLTWETEEDVDEYSLTLYSDAAMTDTVQTIRLDIAAQKVRATAMSSIEVENLDAETEYYYVLTGISADGTIASQKTGSFKTTESASDALKETQQADRHVTVYNLQGVLVLETDDVAALKTLQNGAYIVNGKKMIIVR